MLSTKLIWAAAVAAGIEAATKWDAEDNDWYPCGFATLVIKGRGKFAKELRQMGVARKRYMGGLYIMPVGDHSQQMYRKMAICNAMGKVFGIYGIEAFTESSMD
jgi:hypothetical protein